jgi:hypothetical protein
MKDIDLAKNLLAVLPSIWDGKTCILELKGAEYNWRQMEWIGFYFEFIASKLLRGSLSIPGERINTVTFDVLGEINWDLKTKAIKSDSHGCILNDVSATDLSLQRHGAHGVFLALLDVDYNDQDRSFQKWHTALKEGLSKYEVERMRRTSISRYRKTRAILQEILFLVITPENVGALNVMRQGRNSNGRPRPSKYLVDVEELEPFLVDRLDFTTGMESKNSKLEYR